MSASSTQQAIRNHSSTDRKRIVLITGSSSGFGLLTAITLAQQGWQVIATMRDLSRRTELDQQAQQAGVRNNIHCVRLDVTQPESIVEAIHIVRQQYGRLDVLINNAGYAVGGFIEHVPMEVWRAQLESNVFGLIAVTREVLPMMREQRSGQIINMSSVSGIAAFPGYAPYATSKFAIEGFSESLRHEMASFGVAVVLVEPGAYRTAIWNKGLEDIQTGAQNQTSPYERQLNKILDYSRHSAQHAPHPQQVADLIARIVQTKRPRLRYPVGKGSGLLIWARRLLPAWLLEYIIQRVLR